MKTIKTKLLIVSLCCLFIGNSFAQEMPKAQKDLQRFVGNWECKNSKYNVGGKDYVIDYHFNAKTAIDGAGVVADEFFDHPELGKLRSLNMVNYDPGSSQIHWYTIDNFGTCHDHLGSWTDKDHFSFQVKGLNKGKAFVEKCSCEFSGDNKLTFKITTEEDGKLISSASGLFVK
ncbi:MAG: hypothetical protein WCO63_07460 [Bacteroidota bacterium]